MGEIMNVLSLCDGMSGGQIALKEIGIGVDYYFASEIDINAIKVTQDNFPRTIQIEDVTKIDGNLLNTLPKIDLVLFGFPCRSMSKATSGRKEYNDGLNGVSGLFYPCNKILQWIKQNNNNDVKFLVENVDSNKSNDILEINNLLKTEPILIDSNLFSAQDRIGVDIDNVIYDTAKAVLDIHYENTGEKLNLSDITDYCIEKFVSSKYREDFYKIFLDKRVWKNVKLLPNCVETIRKLHQMGHQIWFVTSTEPANVNGKYKFLYKTFPFINVRKRLITTPCKQMVNIDVLIDDAVHNVINAPYYSILFDYPWNANFDDVCDNKIFRVYDWAQVENVICFIKKIMDKRRNNSKKGEVFF